MQEEISEDEAPLTDSMPPMAVPPDLEDAYSQDAQPVFLEETFVAEDAAAMQGLGNEEIQASNNRPAQLAIEDGTLEAQPFPETQILSEPLIAEPPEIQQEPTEIQQEATENQQEATEIRQEAPEIWQEALPPPLHTLPTQADMDAPAQEENKVEEEPCVPAKQPLPAPPEGEWDLEFEGPTESALKSRLRRIFKPRRDGSFQVAQEFVDMYKHADGQAKVMELFAKVNYDPETFLH